MQSSWHTYRLRSPAILPPRYMGPTGYWYWDCYNVMRLGPSLVFWQMPRNSDHGCKSIFLSFHCLAISFAEKWTHHCLFYLIWRLAQNCALWSLPQSVTPETFIGLIEASEKHAIFETVMSRSGILVMEWHRVVLETPFAGAFTSDIYI